MNPAAVRLIACSQCDLLQKRLLTGPSVGTRCVRCHAVIEPPAHDSFDRPLALVIAAAQAFVLANVFPLVSMDLNGETLSTTLPQAVWALYQHDMASLAALVFFTTLLAPAIQLAISLVLIIGVRSGRRTEPSLFRIHQWFQSWGMLDVLMLGILVALVKLAALARIVPGVALFSFGALLVLLSLLNTSFTTTAMWRR
jgi:paraquat-inducible protein A